ncbi:SRPBCC family protein [Nocardioides jensenii]|uniref:SRPBCC family protein n=1 Tax=Nocardioides jensenii TaxID=1843 RepID=UPI0009E724B4|nr:SRPBCC family protein [Nocardioides jensenii]
MSGVGIHDELFIAAPPERVWALTEDVEGWPRLTPTMTSVTRLETGPFGVGSTARIKQPRLPPATWTVTELDPLRRFFWETRRNGVVVTGGHQIEPVEGGCRNLLTVELSGTGAGVLAVLLGPTLRTAIATENDGFRRGAEGLDRPAYVDEHRLNIDATPEAVWSAVEDFAVRLHGPRRGLLSTVLGLEPASGFAVAERVPSRLLSLQGGHRFSTYALDFRVNATTNGTELCAVTYADFPGPHGFAYRSAVIGSRGHALGVRRLLRQIADHV